MNMTHTRQSLGSQISSALDELVSRGIINAWTFKNSGAGALNYELEDERMFASYSPGNCARMLNELGFDIRFGKNPQDARN